MPVALKIENLHVRCEKAAILRGVNLEVTSGEVVALMGPNGSGKSTLAYVLMGHPAYQITQGKVTWQGEDLLALAPEERARRGMFLSWQYPQEVAGVTIGNFLRLAYNSIHKQPLNVSDFLGLLKERCRWLGIPEEFIIRPVNEGFSGGEKKRTEILQLAVLSPRLAVLDETDSGLDIDALKTVAQAVIKVRERQPDLAILLITHYQRILNHLPADRVVIMKAGQIVQEGGQELLSRVESQGYRSL